MKILKYLGIVMLTLVLAFLSLGFFVKSFEYSTSTSVVAPPEKCWVVLHDTTRMKTWMHGFKRVELKSGQDMQPGAVYEITVVQDKRYIMRETLKEVKAPTFAAYELTNEVMKSDYNFTLVSRNGMTEITSHNRVAGNNLIWRSILFLSKSYLEGSSQTQLDLLKLEIETGEVEFD